MFGMNPKRRGLFGQPGQMPAGILPGDQPEIGMGDFPPQPHHLPQNANAGRKRGGMFGSGVNTGDFLYALGGALNGDGGAAVQQIHQSKMAPLLAEAKRQAELADYEAKKKIDQQYQAPPNNDTLNDMAAAATWTPEQWAIYDKLHPVYRVGPDGIPYPMARSVGAPVPAPAGVTFTPLDDGGPQAPPAGTFR